MTAAELRALAASVGLDVRCVSSRWQRGDRGNRLVRRGAKRAPRKPAAIDTRRISQMFVHTFFGDFRISPDSTL